MHHPTVVDLFAGAGGLSLGFHAAGCRVLSAVEIDESAARTYTENFQTLQPESPPSVFSGDGGNIEELDLEMLAPTATLDFLIGGPPCQGFSRIGRAKLDSLSDEGFAGDPRNSLYQRFLDAADCLKPRAVVMENVPGMLSVDGRDVADEAAADLAARGYRVGYAILNAVWFGVPQFRERLFFLGFRDDTRIDPVMPRTTHRIALPGGYLRPRVRNLHLPFIRHYEVSVATESASIPAVTVSDALGDLPPLTGHLEGETGPRRGAFRSPLHYQVKPHSSYSQLMRSWPGLPTPDCLTDHVIRRTPRDYETFRRMQHGDRYPEALQIARVRFEEELSRLGCQAPDPGTVEFRELERRFVPPYPLHMFVDKWRKLVPDQPSWTVPAHLAKDAYSHIHHDSEQARAISVREAARLQSFPDGFLFTGNMGDCYRQIGNAVPPLLAWSIAHSMLSQMGNVAVSPPRLS